MYVSEGFIKSIASKAKAAKIRFGRKGRIKEYQTSKMHLKYSRAEVADAARKLKLKPGSKSLKTQKGRGEVQMAKWKGDMKAERSWHLARKRAG